MSDYRSVLRSIKKDLLANRLLEARQRSGKTQYQVAQAIGIGESTVCAFENGGLVPNLIIAVELAKYYGVTLGWLLGKTKKEVRKNENEK